MEYINGDVLYKLFLGGPSQWWNNVVVYFNLIDKSFQFYRRFVDIPQRILESADEEWEINPTHL